MPPLLTPPHRHPHRVAAPTDLPKPERAPLPPSVSHVSDATTADDPSATAIAVALDIVARELQPLAATFFRVGADGRIVSSVVHGSHLPPRDLVAAVQTWKAELEGIDPLAPARLGELDRRVATLDDSDQVRPGAPTQRLRRAYRRIGVVNDVRMPIRDDRRVVAGVTLWRSRRGRAWTSAELRMLELLQPLVEHVYLACGRAAARDDWLPADLTPRQRQVARLLATGATNPEVARALQLSPDTAKSHTRAVLSRLGVGSRREVAMLPLRPAAPAAKEAAGAPGVGASYADGLGVLLRLTLDWAAERIGAVVGGCTLLSPRLDVIAQASGVAPSADGALDPRVPPLLQRELAAGPRATRIAERLAADGQPPLVDLDAADATVPAGDRLRDLLARAGLTAPLLLATRLDGRVAALVWVAFDRAHDRRDGIQALRRLHPLLEAACGIACRAALAQAPLRDDLEHRGLTARELAVARLAITGESNEAIADRLGISRATVKNHMTRVLAKCGAGNRTQLIVLASAGDR